ncbi:MAG: hypothetical protein AB1782_17550 [Cyanobacteriota bacterium]
MINPIKINVPVQDSNSKQVEKTFNADNKIGYQACSVVHPESSLIKAYFLGRKNSGIRKTLNSSGVNTEGVIKAFEEIDKKIELSKSNPLQVYIYIEDKAKDIDIFGVITKDKSEDSYILKIKEGHINKTKIDRLKIEVSKEGKLVQDSSKEQAKTQLTFETIINQINENNKNSIKLVPRNPIIAKEEIYEALRKMGPQYLKPQYRKEWSPEDPTFGYCYVTAEVIYHYLAPEGSKPACARTSPSVVHWWVETPDGTILDGTSDQFSGEKIPYLKGKGCGFLTKEPSKRAQILARHLSLEK